MATSLDLSRTYTSYSGVDIRIVINGEYVGSMQALSYAIQREKAPIYVMGSVDPISYSRGKRGIAGTMISLMMDIHLLYHAAFKEEKALLDNDELMIGTANIAAPARGARPGRFNINNVENEGAGGDRFISAGGGFIDRSDRSNIPSGQQLQAEEFGRRSDSGYQESDLNKNYSVRKATYVDQILPFDVVIVAANEYGNQAQMRLFGCEILNEGSGFSIDDMVVENQMTYVCRTILPWRGSKRNEDAVAAVRSSKVRGQENGANGSNAEIYLNR